MTLEVSTFEKMSIINIFLAKNKISQIWDDIHYVELLSSQFIDVQFTNRKKKEISSDEESLSSRSSFFSH